jgi:uncharacterized protein (TIGR00297 family)
LTAREAASAEARRKGVHLGCFLFALSLRWLSWKGALLLAAGALLFNAFVLPHVGGRVLEREVERERGWSAGMLLYPGTILLLVLVFRDRLELVGAAWALMALGDGMASVVGRGVGRRALPWNPGKTWAGFAAHVLFGGVAASFALLWIGRALPVDGGGWPGLVARPEVLVAGFVAALLTAGLESLDSGVDDNLIVPLAGGAAAWLMASLLATAPERDWTAVLDRGLPALAACAALSLAALALASLSWSGAVAATLVGAVVAGFGGWGAFAVLCAFFLLGTGATRAGRAVKEGRGIGEERGGRRAAGNVLANGGLAGACALLITPGTTPDLVPLAGLVLTAGLATAAFDTASSEIGKAFGRHTFLPASGRLVPPGTEGAVSLEGTAAGVVAAALLAVVGWVAGLLPVAEGLAGAGGLILLVTSAAFLGSGFESVVGELSARRGVPIHNDLLNFANTLVGGLAAAWIHSL